MSSFDAFSESIAHWRKIAEDAEQKLSSLILERNRYKADFEELQNHVGEHGCNIANVTKERDRYKAALEEIKNDCKLAETTMEANAYYIAEDVLGSPSKTGE